MKILGLIFHRSFAPRRLITAYIQGRHGPVRCGAGSTLRTGRECGDRRRCERRRLPRTHPLPRRRPTLCSARQLRAECLPGALWLTSLLPNGLHDPSAPIGSHPRCGSPPQPRVCVSMASPIPHRPHWSKRHFFALVTLPFHVCLPFFAALIARTARTLVAMCASAPHLTASTCAQLSPSSNRPTCPPQTPPIAFAMKKKNATRAYSCRGGCVNRATP